MVPDLDFVKGRPHLFAVTEACAKCGQMIDTIALEYGRCVGCRLEWGKWSRYSRMDEIERKRWSARMDAIEQGNAHRFMGRFAARTYRVSLSKTKT